MNRTLESIIKDYIDCYDAIDTLSENNIINDEEYDKLRCSLLEDIIITFRSQVDE